MKIENVIYLLAVFLISGCTTLPVQNRPLEGSAGEAGYRFENVAPGPDNSDSLLVVLTFSGGGTRAASFSYGVLEKLRDTQVVWEGQSRRLLDEVDVISSVSGGSLPAAYYGVFGERIFEDFPEKVLYKNIQGNLLKRLFGLVNIPKLLSRTYGRTDLMADTFNREIFEYRTFDDLLSKNQRPFVLINATDVSLGSRFPFTQQQFDLLNSDLGDYPVSHAVAASAAFPGLLTPMTVRNYPKAPETGTPAWIRKGLENREQNRSRYRRAVEQQSYLLPGRPYIHLVDGGVSDNLGLLPVIEFMNGVLEHDVDNPVFDVGEVKKVVIIVVNAARSPAKDWDISQRVLGLVPVLSAASTIPIGNFSDAELAYLKTYVQQLEQRRELRDRVAELVGEEKLQAELPELAGQDISYHAIEVEFDRVEDPEKKQALNDCPTSFKLSREQVDLLRSAAGEILEGHPEFQELLRELKSVSSGLLRVRSNASE